MKDVLLENIKIVNIEKDVVIIKEKIADGQEKHLDIVVKSFVTGKT